jgi:hypothetical protein
MAPLGKMRFSNVGPSPVDKGASGKNVGTISRKKFCSVYGPRGICQISTSMESTAGNFEKKSHQRLQR